MLTVISFDPVFEYLVIKESFFSLSAGLPHYHFGLRKARFDFQLTPYSNHVTDNFYGNYKMS